jgi:translation initiation factor 5A
MASPKVNWDEVEITYTSANDVRINSIVLLREPPVPCKVVELAKSKPGKHGSAKIKVIGVCLWNGKKYDDIWGSSDNVSVPMVSKMDYSLVDITEDGFITVQGPQGDTRQDLKLDEEFGPRIREMFGECRDGDQEVIITITTTLGIDQISGVKFH